MKALLMKLMPLASSAAFGVTLCVIGKTCRSFLYQPPIPARFRGAEME